MYTVIWCLRSTQCYVHCYLVSKGGVHNVMYTVIWCLRSTQCYVHCYMGSLEHTLLFIYNCFLVSDEYFFMHTVTLLLKGTQRCYTRFSGFKELHGIICSIILSSVIRMNVLSADFVYRAHAINSHLHIVLVIYY